VPSVPQIYKDAAKDDARLGHNESGNICTSSSSTYQIHLKRASECYIGPTWTRLKLLSVQPYNHDTSVFEFELPDPDAYLSLPVTAHLLVRAPETNSLQNESIPIASVDMNMVSEEKKDAAETNELYHARPYTAVEEDSPGKFKIMVKRYAEWGVPESQLKKKHKVFLFSKTDHSYKPAGKVSNHVHSLRVGQMLEFKHNDLCLGRIQYPFDTNVTSITMIAVGAGVAPMIRVLRALIDGKYHNNERCKHVKKIVLLYGARTVKDILQREQLDKWHDQHREAEDKRFQVCYCIGSRWNNIHFASKTDKKEGPPLPEGWDGIKEDRKELGWVNGDKVSRRSASNAHDDGHRVLICGLPAVYLALSGSRFESKVKEGSQLHQLGYRDHQVIKF